MSTTVKSLPVHDDDDDDDNDKDEIEKDSGGPLAFYNS